MPVKNCKHPSIETFGSWHSGTKNFHHNRCIDYNLKKRYIKIISWFDLFVWGEA